jgi:hypothetical protein
MINNIVAATLLVRISPGAKKKLATRRKKEGKGVLATGSQSSSTLPQATIRPIVRLIIVLFRDLAQVPRSKATS